MPALSSQTLALACVVAGCAALSGAACAGTDDIHQTEEAKSKACYDCHATAYQVVQTPKHVMIFSELIHDARIVRIGGTHLPSTVQLWLGDSIGRWEGNTLVVDTTNFSERTHFRSSGPRLHVVERFTRTSETTIDYRFTVDDPETWASPWRAEVPFRAVSERIYEYACHEANYSMANMMRGARAEERKSGR